MITGEYKSASLGSLAIGLVVAVALVAWLGFGDDASTETDDGEPATSTTADRGPADAVGNVDGPLIRNSLPHDLDGDDAGVGGTLVLRDGCLLFEYGEDAANGYLPIIWPGGTSWDDEAREVVLAGGERIGVGDLVTGGGGYPYATELAWLDDEAQALAQRCADNEWDEVAQFNNQPDAARPAG